MKTWMKCGWLAWTISVAAVVGGCRWMDGRRSSGVTAVLEAPIERGEISGMVSVLSDPDYNLTVDCVGWADVEKKVPMRMDSVFAVFSMTKTFTGCALMVAVDRGLIRLEDPVSKYLPEFASVSNPITIRDCMCHMTGIDGGDSEAVHTPVSVREQARTFAKNGKCARRIGQEFRYGNASVNAAAACLEVAVGMPYDEFLRKNVLDPLEMKDTTFVPDADQLRRLVKAYTTKGGPFKPAADDCNGQLKFPVNHPIYPMPAAGLYSTPADMIRFSQMLAHHGERKGVRIVSRKTFDEIWAVKQTPKHVAEPYTVGSWLYGDWFGHEGAMRTDQRANLKTGHCRVFFIQTENAAGKAFFDVKEKWNAACDKYQGMDVPFSEDMVRTVENDQNEHKEYMAVELPPIITNCEIRINSSLSGKKAFYYCDDVIWLFRDLTRQRPKSMFDNAFLKLMKEAHDKYGFKVQLNCFYRTDFFYGTDEFTLAEMTDAYKAEWQANKDWLKLGFHSLQEFPDYPFINADYKDMKRVLDLIGGEIARFAGDGVFAKGAVVHWGTCSKEACRALKDAGFGILLASCGPRKAYNGDPSVLPYGHAMRLEQNRKPETSLYSRISENEAISSSIGGYNNLTYEQARATYGSFRYVYDREVGIGFKELEDFQPLAAGINLYTMENLIPTFEKYANNEFLVYGNHEQYFYEDYLAYQPEYAAKVLAAAKFLKENGYSFFFFEDLVRVDGHHGRRRGP